MKNEISPNSSIVGSRSNASSNSNSEVSPCKFTFTEEMAVSIYSLYLYFINFQYCTFYFTLLQFLLFPTLIIQGSLPHFAIVSL